MHMVNSIAVMYSVSGRLKIVQSCLLVLNLRYDSVCNSVSAVQALDLQISSTNRGDNSGLIMDFKITSTV